MSYRIDIHREMYTIISHLDSGDLSPEDIARFLNEIIEIGESFIEDKLPCLYHVLLTSETHFDFGTILRSLNSLRQNEAMINVRRQLNMMTILVGSGMQNLQFTQHMMSTPQYGGRPIAILPTLDLALESVRRDIMAQGLDYTSPFATDGHG
jgi:hypothetical protein